MLRRDNDPEDEILEALLPEAAPRMTCPTCKAIGLSIAEHDELESDDDWQAAKLCELCRLPIDPERLEVLPEAQRCAKCQTKAEAGIVEEEPEFCPRCGSLVELRVSRSGGLTRYRRFCTGSPPCRL